MSKVGGAELQQSLIAKSLRQSGHQVSFLVHDFDQPDIMENDQGIRLIKTFGLKKSSFLLRHVTPLRLFRGLNLADADVYYQRNGGAITGLVAAFCKLKRRKFIFAAASQGDVDGTKKHKGSRSNRLLYTYGIKQADVVLAQSEYQKDMIRKNFRKSSVVIRNIYQMPSEVAGDGRYVLWVGSFYDVKRPELCLEIASRLPEYKFVMVGRPVPSRGDYYETSMETAASLSNVEIRQPVPYSEVGGLFSEALALLCTSVSEGFPNVFLDAFSRRVPVVSTVDPDEIVCRHELGFHRESAEDLASALRTLLSDESRRREMGENAYTYVLENHEFNAVKKQYDVLLNRLLSSVSVCSEGIEKA
jgi:glycosyltransferase involved in cell wall biosynthesis